jgi:2-polyprenyl-3-methyl-5-hydroxy-6-metoxy-1,4-benzoquinol methylase
MTVRMRRRLHRFLLYAADRLMPPSDALTPPRTLQALVGGGDFEQIGANWLHRLITCGGLLPEDSVPDVGCGVGRLAIPLTSYLTSGSYEGFDVVPTAIDWCQRHITSRFPRFSFHCADVYSRFYNPTSRIMA